MKKQKADVLQVAKFIKNSEKINRLNKVYDYCYKQGLDIDDIDFVLKYINGCVSHGYMYSNNV